MSHQVNQELNYQMKTPWAEGVGDIPWNVYPRPQLKRDSFFCLNGAWNLSVETTLGIEEPIGIIRVPFPPESSLSGVMQTLDEGDTWIYRRTFSFPNGFVKDRTILHFGAVDQEMEVYVNDQLVGAHKGGYLAFSFDVSSCLKDGENSILVRVKDPTDTTLAVGKQRKKRGGIWYTPISGIWQTVWIESVPRVSISSLKIFTWYDYATIDVLGDGLESLEKKIVIDTEYGKEEFLFTGTTFKYIPKFPHDWNPEDPYLYYFTVSLPESGDQVSSYLALRSVATGTPEEGVHAHQPHIYVNGMPPFFHGVLDQGYYSDGIYLPASPEGYASDIHRVKELGFNTIRKHIKIEPELFYYECDRQGIFLFQDIVNSGDYHMLPETILPTVGIEGNPNKKDEVRQDIYLDDLKGTLSQLYNHPSLIGYTLFNEGWGQFNTDAFYRIAKELDSTRVIDSASGWFDTDASDLKSIHCYMKDIAKELDKTHCQRAQFLTEFGGYALEEEGHEFNPRHTFGYSYVKTREELTEKLEAVYREKIMPQIAKGLCGSIYTQLSDVEDELNGLLTYDRQVVKPDVAKMYQIGEDFRTLTHLRPSDTSSAIEHALEPGGNLLLGDSITDMYPTERFLADYRVYNRGFSGDRSDQLLHKLPNTLGVLRPDTIIILIGSNDIGHGFDVNQTEDNLRKIAKAIQERVPNAKVHLITVLPSNPDAKLEHPKHEMFTSVRPNDVILEFDRRQERIAKELGWECHDFGAALKDEKGRLREDYTVEGLHLNETAYGIWSEMLKPLLSKEKITETK